jgi:hypothetical protein
MSFERMRKAIRQGFLYQKDDLQIGQDRKTKKPTITFRWRTSVIAWRRSCLGVPSGGPVLADECHIFVRSRHAQNERADVLGWR